MTTLTTQPSVENASASAIVTPGKDFKQPSAGAVASLTSAHDRAVKVDSLAKSAKDLTFAFEHEMYGKGYDNENLNRRALHIEGYRETVIKAIGARAWSQEEKAAFKDFIETKEPKYQDILKSPVFRGVKSNADSAEITGVMHALNGFKANEDINYLSSLKTGVQVDAFNKTFKGLYGKDPLSLVTSKNSNPSAANDAIEKLAHKKGLPDDVTVNAAIKPEPLNQEEINKVGKAISSGTLSLFNRLKSLTETGSSNLNKIEKENGKTSENNSANAKALESEKKPNQDKIPASPQNGASEAQTQPQNGIYPPGVREFDRNTGNPMPSRLVGTTPPERLPSVDETVKEKLKVIALSTTMNEREKYDAMNGLYAETAYHSNLNPLRNFDRQHFRKLIGEAYAEIPQAQLDKLRPDQLRKLAADQNMIDKMGWLVVNLSENNAFEKRIQDTIVIKEGPTKSGPIAVPIDGGIQHGKINIPTFAKPIGVQSDKAPVQHNAPNENDSPVRANEPLSIPIQPSGDLAIQQEMRKIALATNLNGQEKLDAMNKLYNDSKSHNGRFDVRKTMDRQHFRALIKEAYAGITKEQLKDLHTDVLLKLSADQNFIDKLGWGAFNLSENNGFENLLKETLKQRAELN